MIVTLIFVGSRGLKETVTHSHPVRAHAPTQSLATCTDPHSLPLP
jgi:hypothetical protein